jgi:hypothetical protein
MDFEETETMNDCAGEAQQQFNRPTDRVSELLVGELVRTFYLPRK